MTVQLSFARGCSAVSSYRGSPEIWLKTRPPTSTSAHLFMKAVQQWDLESGVVRNHSSESIFDQVLGRFAVRFFRTVGISLAGIFNVK